jgi:CRISPR/Cas system CMR-associated protein Cmr5 small subunit
MTIENGLCGYVAFYQGKRIEVYAETLYAAQKKAAEQLKVPAKKQYLISVTLCERADGTEVIHTATS